MSTLAPFLLPEGFTSPGLVAALREASVVGETGRLLMRSLSDLRPRWRGAAAVEAEPFAGQPVVLVPGFLAGDRALTLLSSRLRREGYRTYRSQIRANVGCTASASKALEVRVEAIARRRGSQVAVVGHSLGGLLARGLAVRRPDLVSNIVTLGSPMLAPAAHHASLARSVELLVRLSRAGVPGLMAEDCVAGPCARASFDEARAPMPAAVGFTAIYSKRDGIVDWRACIDPLAAAVEVAASHTGMAFDPRVADAVVAALSAGSVLEVDGGVGA